MAIEVFKSIAQSKKGTQVECDSRGHKFIIDEPKKLGGTDTGANPVEALLAALGACKCIVIKSFARKHGIDIKDLKVEVEGDLDTDGFLGKNKAAKMGFTNIKTKIYIESDTPREQLEEFIGFVNRTCPVSDTLENSPNLESELIIK
ncbi:MAG: OsmC family protein [Victivallaceae bacterium]|nr:OsmC family protein [Victivallaceae bacterium]